MSDKKTGLIDLFLTFARIGGLTFGGGYAMLPMLERETVEKRNWCTEEELLDYFAVGQCTPGIIAVNTATFIGYKTRGIAGGIAATLGVVAPSIVIISIIYHVLAAFSSNIWVAAALGGIRVAVAALITIAVIRLSKKSIVDIPTALIALFSLALMLAFDISPIVFVFIGIVAGLTINLIKARKEAKND